MIDPEKNDFLKGTLMVGPTAVVADPIGSLIERTIPLVVAIKLKRTLESGRFDGERVIDGIRMVAGYLREIANEMEEVVNDDDIRILAMGESHVTKSTEDPS